MVEREWLSVSGWACNNTSLSTQGEGHGGSYRGAATSLATASRMLSPPPSWKC